MVLESLFNPFSVKKKPWEMFIAGFFYTFVAVFLAYFVFKEVSGILMVFLIIMSTLPVLYTTIKQEEELDLKYKKESTRSFFVILEVDGGLPIKRFVEGINVDPSISKILDTKCTCIRFDINQILP